MRCFFITTLKKVTQPVTYILYSRYWRLDFAAFYTGIYTFHCENIRTSQYHHAADKPVLMQRLMFR